MKALKEKIGKMTSDVISWLGKKGYECYFENEQVIDGKIHTPLIKWNKEDKITLISKYDGRYGMVLIDFKKERL